MTHVVTGTTNRLLCIAAILIAAIPCAAKGPADPEVEALFANMRRAYAAVKTARIETVAVSRAIDAQKFQSRLRIFTTHIVYRRPDVIRAYVQSAGQLVGNLIVDGYRRMQFNGQDKNAPNDFVFLVDTLQRQINLESICFWDWRRQLSTDPNMNMSRSTFRLTHDVPWNGKRWMVLEETASASNEVIDYYIDPKTYFVWRTYTRSISSRQEQQETKLKSLVINQPITDEDLRHYEAMLPLPRPPVIYGPLISPKG